MLLAVGQSAISLPISYHYVPVYNVLDGLIRHEAKVNKFKLSGKL